MFPSTYIAVIVIVKSFRANTVNGCNADVFALIHWTGDHLYSLELVSIPCPAQRVADGLVGACGVLWQTHRSHEVCHLHWFVKAQKSQHAAFHGRRYYFSDTPLLLPWCCALYAHRSESGYPFHVWLTLQND